MQRRHFIRFAQAFNATCTAAALDLQPLTKLQAQILFDQLALACSDLGDNFSHAAFEDACQHGFDLAIN